MTTTVTTAPRIKKQTMTINSEGSRSRSRRSAGYAPSMGVNMNQRYIEQSLSKATRAVNLLQKNGFYVEHMELGNGGKPRIKISWHPKVTNLGEPAVYSKGNNGIHYETCLVQYEDCQVSWTRR